MSVAARVRSHVASSDPLTSLRVWKAVLGSPTPSRPFRVFQYNSLADSLATGSEGPVDPVPCAEHFRSVESAGVHYHCEPLAKCHTFRASQEHLCWEYRFPVLLRTILSQNPDVVCLQEVDHFDQFQRLLSEHGYVGRFCKKKGRQCSDGGAVFWRSSVFTEVAWKGFQLLPNNVMTALAVRLVTESGLPLVVCSTHLKAGFSNEMEHVRSKQAEELIRQLSNFAGLDPIVIGADFNAHCSAYCLCTSKRCCDSDEQVLPLVVPLMESHGYRSAYGGYPSFTTWGGWLDRDVKATLDYIFLRGDIVATSALDVPPEQSIADYPQRLPNEDYASDHIFLAVDVCLTSVTEPTMTSASQRFAPGERKYEDVTRTRSSRDQDEDCKSS